MKPKSTTDSLTAVNGLHSLNSTLYVWTYMNVYACLDTYVKAGEIPRQKGNLYLFDTWVHHGQSDRCEWSASHNLGLGEVSMA